MSVLKQIQVRLNVPKNLKNNFGNYKYRNVESIYEALKPLLAEYSCSVVMTDDIVMIGNRFYVKATASLRDEKGTELASSTAFAREDEAKKGMDLSQLTGSCSSYARKYALGGLFLLDDNKDIDELDNRQSEQVQKVAKQVNANLALTNAKKAFMNAVIALGVAKEQVAEFVVFYGLKDNTNANDWQSAVSDENALAGYVTQFLEQ